MGNKEFSRKKTQKVMSEVHLCGEFFEIREREWFMETFNLKNSKTFFFLMDFFYCFSHLRIGLGINQFLKIFWRAFDINLELENKISDESIFVQRKLTQESLCYNTRPENTVKSGVLCNQTHNVSNLSLIFPLILLKTVSNLESKHAYKVSQKNTQK